MKTNFDIAATAVNVLLVLNAKLQHEFLAFVRKFLREFSRQ